MSRLVCFTTPEAKRRRVELGVKPEPNEEYELPMKAYLENYWAVRSAVQETVDRLIYAYSLVLDVAPLTKTYSDSLTAISLSYSIPRVYCGEGRIVQLGPRPLKQA